MTVRILVGDVRARLADIETASVHCCVTSPPYFGLRNYGVEGQIGLEASLDAYLDTLVDVFRGVWRVLRDDGTCWVNIGDSYNAHPGQRKTTDAAGPKQITNGGSTGAASRYDPGLKPKDLMLVPARLAIALQDDGWWIRSDIIWHKKASMPESVTDRPTSAHEHIFLLTKNKTYFYDADAVREEHETGWRADKWEATTARVGTKTLDAGGTNGTGTSSLGNLNNPAGRNLRNVWTLSPEPFPAAHFATFPTEIPRRCIKAGTSEKGACAACGSPWRRVVERERGDMEAHARPKHLQSAKSGLSLSGNGSKEWAERGGTAIATGWEPTCVCGDTSAVAPCRVLDPFGGSGTTGLVADELGRDCDLIELNPTYADLARDRIRGASPLFAAVDVA